MLTRLHPLTKLALCLLWIGAALLVFDLRFQLVALALAFGLLWGLERVALWKLAALAVPFALFGLGVLSTSVLFHRDTGLAVQAARPGIAAAADPAHGLVLFCRVLACGMISALFALTTDPGRLVRTLVAHLRLPPAMGLALLQAMHLVPDLGREAMALRMARAMRLGRPLRRLPTPPEVMALAIPLLAFAIRRAGRAAIALEARGFRPGHPRSAWPQPGPTRIDLAAAVAGSATLAGVLAAL